MVKVEASVIIDRPIEEVWKFITDLSKYPKWTDVLEMRQTSAGPLGVGTTIQGRYAKMLENARIIEYEPNRKLTFEITSGPTKGTTNTLSMETIEGKTRFARTVDHKFGGFYKLVWPFVAGRVKRYGEASVGNVKRMLESAQP
jgi:uncharacterized protein YndB with AHSA1/START domain